MSDTPQPNQLSLRLVIKPFRDCLVFTGRSTRSEALIFSLLTCPLATAAGKFVLSPDPFAPPPLYMSGWAALCWLPGIALMVRRLHDQGRTAWWMLIHAAALLTVAVAALLPQTSGGISMGFLVWRVHPAPGPVTTLLMVADIALVFAMFAIDVWPGQAGSNRFGPDPRLEPPAGAVSASPLGSPG
jgi:uncharacterized membrane protein YhaH (DUF805 family)